MRPGSGSRATLSSVVPGLAVTDDVGGERLGGPVGERVGGDHHHGHRRSSVAPEVAPERQAGSLGGDVPEGDVDEAERPHDEAGAPDRDRGARGVLEASLRVGLAARNHRSDEALDTRGDRRVAGEAVGRADETVVRLHLDTRVLALPDLQRPEPQRLRAAGALPYPPSPRSPAELIASR